ncbi:amino acid ABC transporter substrate-binding protein, PAAT family [Tistlia consotensis]|uniref:Amino acid ABC transporter substrate-binding protein, PAAT family n=1 Tax=Tistlia consotensis USBA 355 TaxID=560819 RepID=A0A1Y6CWE0_9PROT|nr:transporter substrate-binding domain-containing protein [Tistlia consotensis]SMF82414.1 amino acid ABC transporter substrate-binding protein, PAAT family [Tistlia consotensis USBA 355]SNS27228.1 amino acid ABC transporter substrate-binding protein, PAAT family [Tistlia consotensis]
MNKLIRSAVLGTTAALALALVASVAPGTATATTLKEVKDKGTLVVGVKADYKPYGFLDSDGKIVGIEPTLAADVAKKLGVKLELVPVVSSNRMQFLEQGKIDLMIATMTDTPEREKVVEIVKPNYYSSGTNVMAPKKAKFKEWTDLKGVPVCGIQGAFYNRKTQEQFGADIVAFKGTAEALTALKQGRCVAFVYDDSFLISKLGDPEWADYDMPLKTIDDAPWGLAVAKGADKFAAFMSDMIKDWHKTGRILELETKYGVKNTPFALEMHEKYKGS